LIWLLKDFDLLSVLLRAMTLSLEALTLGGVAFLLFAALPAGAAAGTVQSRELVRAGTRHLAGPRGCDQLCDSCRRLGVSIP
jgi:hypothetical protein